MRMPLAVNSPVRSTALLADVYRRLHAVSPLLSIEAGPPEPGGDWVTGRQLTEDQGTLELLIAAEESRIRDLYGVRARRDVAATWVLHRYAFTVALAMSGPWYLDRRVPRLSPDGVAYAWRTRRVAVAEAESVSCLMSDPAAGSPGVRAVADEESLRAELRDAVAAHLAPVLEAFRPAMRRGARALWGMATDELAEGIWHLGRALGDQREAARAAEALLPGGTAPYAGRAGFRDAPRPAGGTTRTRNGCCLFYTIRPDEICDTCPRLSR
ncbi:(2Fe-2S)-binding protein [Streptomyces sp. NPDC020330]|uniref:(2Fe-2S)-binding protein n=1 Tax=unclassified Streptomyces TaxID=2593676 RepID=UPI00378C996E